MNGARDKISVLLRPTVEIELKVLFFIVLLAGALYEQASAITSNTVCW